MSRRFRIVAKESRRFGTPAFNNSSTDKYKTQTCKFSNPYRRMKTKQKIFLGLLIVTALGCTTNKNAGNDDVYDILNTLLKTNYNEAELVVLNLKENKEYYADNEISDSIVGSASEYNEPPSPPPSLQYTSYSKYFFTQLYHLKLIDSVDVACMYNQLESTKKE